MTDQHPIWISTVGRFAVHRDGAVLSMAGIGTRKARTLLALLAVLAPRHVPLDRIVNALWPHPPRRPVADAATLVSRLRALLGPEGIQSTGNGYRLGTAVRVDLHQAAALLTAAEVHLAASQPARALAVASRAVSLLDDEILADERPADWIEPVRIRHAQLLRRARHAAAEAALCTGAAAAAAALAADAVHVDPLDETGYRHLMRASDMAGEPARALRAYETLRNILTCELGVDPDPATRELHVRILRRNAARSGRIDDRKDLVERCG